MREGGAKGVSHELWPAYPVPLPRRKPSANLARGDHNCLHCRRLLRACLAHGRVCAVGCGKRDLSVSHKRFAKFAIRSPWPVQGFRNKSWEYAKTACFKTTLKIMLGNDAENTVVETILKKACLKHAEKTCLGNRANKACLKTMLEKDRK